MELVCLQFHFLSEYDGLKIEISMHIWRGSARFSRKLLILNVVRCLQIRLDQFDSGSRLQTCGTSPADESLQGFLLCALDAESASPDSTAAVHFGMKKPRACLGN